MFCFFDTLCKPPAAADGNHLIAILLITSGLCLQLIITVIAFYLALSERDDAVSHDRKSCVSEE
ncbi:hypothetical protein SAMN02744778_03134 [Pantoea sp. GL120224-02]|nr:hypothetical protein SAMN02744778_03134 [Pantoea sp. GL120224-02]